MAPANRYLFAISAIEVGAYDEAERALLGNMSTSSLLATNPDITDSIPGGAAGLYLLGSMTFIQQKSPYSTDMRRENCKEAT